MLKISDMTIKDYGKAVHADGSCANPEVQWERHTPYNKHEIKYHDHTDEQTVYLGQNRLLVLTTDCQTFQVQIQPLMDGMIYKIEIEKLKNHDLRHKYGFSINYKIGQKDLYVLGGKYVGD